MFIQRTDIPAKAYSNVGTVPINDLNKLKMTHDIRECYDSMMTRYGDLLSEQLRNQAFGLTFGYQMPDDYKSTFLANILMCAYNMFDKKGNLIHDENYDKILKRIHEHNPEWENSFVRRYETWKSMLEERRRKAPIRPSQ